MLRSGSSINSRTRNLRCNSRTRLSMDRSRDGILISCRINRSRTSNRIARGGKRRNRLRNNRDGGNKRDGVLKYVAGSIKLGVLYESVDNFKLVGYSDSDWVGFLDDRKSTSDFVFSLGLGAIT